MLVLASAYLDNAWHWDQFEKPTDILVEDERVHSSDSHASGDSQRGEDECMTEDEYMSQSSDIDKTVRQILHEWNVSMDPNNIPVCIVPAPIAYLMVHSQWKSILLRHWDHYRLVDGEGKRFDNMQLLPGVRSVCKLVFCADLFYRATIFAESDAYC